MQRSYGVLPSVALAGLQQAACLSMAAKAAASSQTAAAEQLAPDLPQGLPNPKPFQIKSVVLKASSVSLDQCPAADRPEIAVVGRSNVGKSSLINMLTSSSKLAHVSKTPGKTQVLNHYLINSSWYLVDCPGYGYARAGKASRLQWLQACEQLCLYRPTLANVLLLVDSSIPAKTVDLEAAQWFAEHQVPFSVVFTKADKKKAGCPAPAANIAAFRAQLSEMFEPRPPSLVTSAQAGQGRGQLLSFISQLLQLDKQQHQQRLAAAPQRSQQQQQPASSG